tara:strand:+ start:1650 stop:2036 length:387 start_codon:yes stop_codon:yes gene_type:complete
MATHHGKEGVIKVGSDVAGEVTGFTLETTGDVVEDTQLSDAAKSFIAGRTSFSGSIDMNYDETDTAQENLTVGSSVSFTVLPEGNTSGDQSFTGSGIVTSMGITNGMDAVVTRTVNFQGSGALTKGTV